MISALISGGHVHGRNLKLGGKCLKGTGKTAAWGKASDVYIELQAQLCLLSNIPHAVSRGWCSWGLGFISPSRQALLGTLKRCKQWTSIWARVGHKKISVYEILWPWARHLDLNSVSFLLPAEPGHHNWKWICGRTTLADSCTQFEMCLSHPLHHWSAHYINPHLWTLKKRKSAGDMLEENIVLMCMTWPQNVKRQPCCLLLCCGYTEYIKCHLPELWVQINWLKDFIMWNILFLLRLSWMSIFYIKKETHNTCFSEPDLFHLTSWSLIPTTFLW